MTPSRCVLGLLLLSTACAQGERSTHADSLRTAGSRLTVEQGQQMQGQQMQGQQMQGTQLVSGTRQTESLFAHRLTGVVLEGSVLEAVRVERGGLVGERTLPPEGSDGVPTRETLRGARWVGAELVGESDWGATVRYRITGVRPELAHHDATGAGDTFLYTVEWQDKEGRWLQMCAPDAEGLQVAIPVGAVFDRTGARRESTTHFTFGCTSGVIAKCYRWGYKPWLTHPEDAALMRNLHWACTRMARADYCGDGTTHTRDGTLINFWDTVPPPGPFQTRGEPVPGMFFEAGWSTSGAVCLSKARWLELSPEVVSACSDRLIPPGSSTGLATVCDSPLEALELAPGVHLFNESRLNGP